jgi:hypothetical protein
MLRHRRDRGTMLICNYDGIVEFQALAIATVGIFLTCIYKLSLPSRHKSAMLHRSTGNVLRPSAWHSPACPKDNE